MHFGEEVLLGDYKLKVRALDILGNAQEEWGLTFKNPLEGDLLGVFNQPNPMQNSTVFIFKGRRGASLRGEFAFGIKRDTLFVF